MCFCICSLFDVRLTHDEFHNNAWKLLLCLFAKLKRATKVMLVITGLLFERWMLLSCFSPFVVTTNKQFGFEPQHGSFTREDCITLCKQIHSAFSAFLDAAKTVFLNHLTYVAHMTFCKIWVARYFVSILGYAFICINKHSLFWCSQFIPECHSVRILLLNTMCSHAVVIRYLDNCILTCFCPNSVAHTKASLRPTSWKTLI